ncbi:MAG: N-acetylglucosamine-6-phosphate deacetylase [Amnibacterium sp.]
MTVLVAHVVRPGAPARLERLRLDGGAVVAATPLETAEPGEAVLPGVVLPGFVDGHLHGALGFDFGTATVAEARRIAAFHHRAGATDLVATLATAPLPDLEAQLARLRPLVEEGVLAGFHLEGPFLAEERRGCHAPELLRSPDARSVDRLVEAADGALRTVTIAPELDGALEAIRALTEAGVRAQVGHTACSAEVAQAALDAGAVGFTHLFNGMPPMAGREPRPGATALRQPGAFVEIIADGVHLADASIDLVRRLAGGRTALVSDAMSATGLGDGETMIAGSPVAVVNGVARARSNGSLAGSTTTLGDVVERLARRGIPEAELAELSSGAASRTHRLSRTLSPGDPADLVVLGGGAGERRITGVLRRGRWLTPEPAGGPVPPAG